MPYYCPCCDSPEPLINSEEYECGQCGVSIPKSDQETLRTTKQAYTCPFCESGAPLRYTGQGNIFECSSCGERNIIINGFKPPVIKKPEDSACLVCGSAFGVNANKLLYERSVFNGTQQGYFHDACHEQWKEQIANDYAIINWQIAMQDLLPKIKCEFCRETASVSLQPWQYDRNMWECGKCELAIGENYVYDELVKLGAEIIKCQYCGYKISMAAGHDCKLKQRITLRK